jgi:hypothetical protein
MESVKHDRVVIFAEYDNQYYTILNETHMDHFIRMFCLNGGSDLVVHILNMSSIVPIFINLNHYNFNTNKDFVWEGMKTSDSIQYTRESLYNIQPEKYVTESVVG